MWPHLFSATLKACTHFLTVPAEWGISPLWSLGGIKPSCNTPQGHNTSYTQPAPLAHTAIPLIQLFLIFKTQKHNSYFFFIFWPWGSHTPKVTGQGSHTQVLFWLRSRHQPSARKTSSKLWINKLTPNQTKICKCAKMALLKAYSLGFQKAPHTSHDVLNPLGGLCCTLELVQQCTIGYSIRQCSIP